MTNEMVNSICVMLFFVGIAWAAAWVIVVFIRELTKETE
jgi:hypothetical protein